MHSLRDSFARLTAFLALSCAIVLAGAKPAVNGLIWRATSKDATIYLVGSVHFGDKSMYPLPPIYDVALEQATALVEEVKDMDNPTTLTPLMEKYAMYPAGDSLAQHLKPQTLQRVQEFCKSNSIPFETFSRFRPWVVSLMIPMVPQMLSAQKGDGLSSFPGIDEYFARKARAEHKPIVGVETAEFQIKLLMNLPGADQDEAVRAALDSSPTSKGQTDEIVASWVKGDAQGIEKESSKVHFPRAILEDRNYRMADAAESYLKSHKPCLFVVGALHLVGKEGIVELLRARGYTVVQIVSTKVPRT